MSEQAKKRLQTIVLLLDDASKNLSLSEYRGLIEELAEEVDARSNALEGE